MKKLLLISLLIAAMPLAMMAQDDDLYFVPKKNKTVSTVEKINESSYEAINGDTTKLDIIEFSGGKGIYPDSLAEDFELTKKMQRFDDYNLCDNAAFWAGYNAGRYDWAWHSPWYYRAYGWYDPWFYGSWYRSYYPWYSSWYYPYYYAWYDPWYGWPYYYGYYYPWGYPYYFGGGGGSGHYYGHTGNARTINIHGGSRVFSHGGSFSQRNNSRQSSLRDRSIGSVRSSGGNVRNSSRGSYSTYSLGQGSRMNTSRSSGYSGSSSRSRGSYSSGGSHSSGGSFGGGRSSGGGGGSRMGGRR